MDEQNELYLRLGAFLAVLSAMVVWETLSPRRMHAVQKRGRWTSNLSLVVVNTLLVRVIIPITAVAAAIFAESHNWGLLHLVHWPFWQKTVLAVVIFDLAIYLQHVMFHAVPLFWRFHMVHHVDLDFDVTTGLRFHTLEILLSAMIKLGIVLVLGPSAIAVVAFEVLLNATSMFNHSNVKMPHGLDRCLRWFVVTPDMHRVHHSVIHRETNSNFGFNLPWWDYLLGTYQAQPRDGHQKMQIGIAAFSDERQVDRLFGMLLLPFRKRRSASMLEADHKKTQSGTTTVANEE